MNLKERVLNLRQTLPRILAIGLISSSLFLSGCEGDGGGKKTPTPPNCSTLTGLDYLKAAADGQCPCPPSEGNWSKSFGPQGACKDAY